MSDDDRAVRPDSITKQRAEELLYAAEILDETVEDYDTNDLLAAAEYLTNTSY